MPAGGVSLLLPACLCVRACVCLLAGLLACLLWASCWWHCGASDSGKRHAGGMPTDVWVKILRQAADIYAPSTVSHMNWHDGLKTLCHARAVCKQLRAAVDLALQPPGQATFWLCLTGAPAGALDSPQAQQAGHVYLDMSEFPSQSDSFRRFFAQSQLTCASIQAADAACAADADSAVSTSTPIDTLFWTGRVPTQLPARLQQLNVTPGPGPPPDALEELLFMCASRCPELRCLHIDMYGMDRLADEDLDLDYVNELRASLRASHLSGLQLPSLQFLCMRVSTFETSLLDLTWMCAPRTFKLLLEFAENCCTSLEAREIFVDSLPGLLQPGDSLSISFTDEWVVPEFSIEEQQVLAQLQLDTYVLELPAGNTIHCLPQASELTLTFFEALGVPSRVAWSAISQCPSEVQLNVSHGILEVFGCDGSAAPTLSDAWSLEVSADLIVGLPAPLSACGNTCIWHKQAWTDAERQS